MGPEQSKAIFEHLFSPDDPSNASLFAVLDGARDRNIAPELRRSGIEFECLFSGRLSPALRDAAPYLARVTEEHPFTHYLLEKGWGQSWGIFLSSDESLPVVRRHLRTLLRVRSEDGKWLFFRYYDPRVLRVFLPTCDVQQTRQVFGPVLRFDVEGPDGESLMRYTLTPDLCGAGLFLATQTLPLHGAGHLGRDG